MADEIGDGLIGRLDRSSRLPPGAPLKAELHRFGKPNPPIKNRVYTTFDFGEIVLASK